jgi:hypothetical protein
MEHESIAMPGNGTEFAQRLTANGYPIDEAARRHGTNTFIVPLSFPTQSTPKEMAVRTGIELALKKAGLHHNRILVKQESRGLVTTMFAIVPLVKTISDIIADNAGNIEWLASADVPEALDQYIIGCQGYYWLEEDGILKMVQVQSCGEDLDIMSIPMEVLEILFTRNQEEK